MCFRGSSVFVGSFPGAFSRARDKISQLTHVYKHLPRVACCLIKMLSIKFRSIFAAPFSRGSDGKQVLYLMTVSCRFSSPCCSGTSAQKKLDLAVFECLRLGHCDHVIIVIMWSTSQSAQLCPDLHGVLMGVSVIRISPRVMDQSTKKLRSFLGCLRCQWWLSLKMLLLFESTSIVCNI